MSAMEQKIPLVDLRAQYLSIKDEVDKAIHDVIDSSAFINGPFLKDFEKDFAASCNRKYCIGVSSGTSALKLALQALGVKTGDEVITVPNTFIATVEAITEIGAKPVFVDVEYDSMNMDPGKLESAITKRTKAILPVHLYGQAANVKELSEIARKHGLVILEDAAQAHLAEHHGKRIPYAGIAAFSFYPGKNLGAYGDAGCVVCDDEKIALTIRQLANHGRGEGEKYLHHREGFNHRMDALQAAILRVKLRHLNEWTEKRRRHAEEYRKLLGEISGITLPVESLGNKHVYYVEVLRAKNRDKLLAHLRERGVEAQIHYPIPLHMQPAFAHLNLRKGMFPVAERSAEEILSIPMFPELTVEQMNRVAAAVEEFYA